MRSEISYRLSAVEGESKAVGTEWLSSSSDTQLLPAVSWHQDPLQHLYWLPWEILTPQSWRTMEMEPFWDELVFPSW